MSKMCKQWNKPFRLMYFLVLMLPFNVTLNICFLISRIGKPFSLWLIISGLILLVNAWIYWGVNVGLRRETTEHYSESFAPDFKSSEFNPMTVISRYDKSGISFFLFQMILQYPIMCLTIDQNNVPAMFGYELVFNVVFLLIFFNCKIRFIGTPLLYAADFWDVQDSYGLTGVAEVPRHVKIKMINGKVPYWGATSKEYSNGASQGILTDQHGFSTLSSPITFNVCNNKLIDQNNKN